MLNSSAIRDSEMFGKRLCGNNQLHLVCMLVIKFAIAETVTVDTAKIDDFSLFHRLKYITHSI